MTTQISWVYLNVFKTKGLNGFLPSSLPTEPLTGKQLLKGSARPRAAGPDGNWASATSRAGALAQGSSGQEKMKSRYLTTGSAKATKACWRPVSDQGLLHASKHSAVGGLLFFSSTTGLPPSCHPCLEGLSSCFCTHSHWAAGMDRWSPLGEYKSRKPAT